MHEDRGAFRSFVMSDDLQVPRVFRYSAALYKSIRVKPEAMEQIERKLKTRIPTFCAAAQ
jgi:hypothetical protein